MDNSEYTETVALSDGLVAEWQAKNFTSGSTTWTDDIAGKKITFSSAATTDEYGISQSRTNSDYWYSESLSSFSLSDTRTYEWYGYINSSCYSSSYPGQIFGASGTNNGWAGICVYAQSSTSYGIQVNIVGSSRVLINSKVTTSGWHHMLITTSGTTVTLYLDSADVAGTGSGTSTYLNKTFSYIYNGEGSGRFDGSVNRIRIWNRVLNSTEIETVFSGETESGVSLKVDGEWNSASNIYKKVDGAWGEISSAQLLIYNKLQGGIFKANPTLIT